MPKNNRQQATLIEIDGAPAVRCANQNCVYEWRIRGDGSKLPVECPECKGRTNLR
jgi:hypothetical protein